MNLLKILLPVLFFSQLSYSQGDTMAVSNEHVSYTQLRKDLSAAIKSHNLKKQVNLYNNIGDYYWYAGNYPRSAENYYTALSISEKTGDSISMGVCYRNIGWIYFGQKNYAGARSYFLKSFGIFNRLQPSRLLPIYDDLANLARESGHYEESVDYCKHAIELAEKTGGESLATATVSLATTYREMGQYDKAIAEYEFAIDLYERNDNPYNEGIAYIDLGKCYVSLKNPDKAIESLEKARKIASDNHFSKLSLDVTEALGPAYALTENYPTAYFYRNRYALMADSIRAEQDVLEIQRMHQQHQGTKRLNYIRNLQKEKDFGQRKLAQEQRYQVVLLVFLFIVVALAFFFFRSFVQKKRANEKLSETYRLLEEQNNDIADSIHYAKRIQTARLPDEKLFTALFPESFCIFRPKDVVSGDFYWVSGTAEEPLIVAADCTGHGVPGAFMSLIGMDSLEGATRSSSDPGEILAESNRLLKRNLKQKNEADSSRDGMDAAVCRFLDSNTLVYAGANRPAWIVRNGALAELAPAKTGIGGFTADNQDFPTQEFSLQAGDTIYLTSDGFGDQFGGPKNKKFSTRQLKELLLSISNEPMHRQKEMLEQAFDRWKDKQEQIDDVLVIGIRVS